MSGTNRERLSDHNLRKDHPEFCSPCSITIYDNDCMMETNEAGVPLMTWSMTANVGGTKGMIKMLERALEAARWVLAKES